MIDQILSLNSLLVFNGQQLLHQVLGLITNIAPIISVEFDPNLHDLLLEFDLVLRFEGRVPAEEDIEYDTDGPPINLLIVLLS